MNAELGVGMDSPQTVAEAIERVLREERNEIMLGKPERLFAKVNALFPALVDRSLRRQLAVIRRYASPSKATRHAATSPSPVDTLRSIES